MYTVVALRCAASPDSEGQDLVVEWTGKVAITYSDAVTLVRRDLWRH